MTRILETTVYTFDELSEEAQEKAIENLRYINVNLTEWWYEGVYDDAEGVAAMLGISIDNIYFSGFNSQGDGACFTGRYEYKKGSVKAIQNHAPEDRELHAIAQGLQNLQKKHFYQLNARITHNYRYFFAKSTDVDAWQDKSPAGGDSEYYPGNEAEAQLASFLHDFMEWIYSNLEQEYRYLTSDKAIEETILCNGYEFTSDGNLV